MAPRKQLANGVLAVPAPGSPPLVPTSKLPASIRFPLVVLLNLSISALLYSLSSEVTAGDLASVSRSVNDWQSITSLVAFKTLELAVGWWGDYDSYDLAALTLLTNLPHLFLLISFYGIRSTTLLSCLAIDIFSTYVPFRLLRPVLASHTATAPKGAVSNRSIISDGPVQVYTALFAAGIYGVIVYGSFGSWLPVHLVTHFYGLRDLSAVYNTLLPKLFLAFLPVGLAAKVLLFTPATGASPDLAAIRAKAFNPESATLLETIRYNVWGFSKRTRTMIKRTATLAAVSGFNTWLQIYVTVEGADGYGAAGWASVWAAAAAITGAAFWWVGHVEGVNN